MHQRRCDLLLMVLLVSGLVFDNVSAQNKRRLTYRRATPPQWDAGKSSEVFFEDAFDEALTGDRPSDLGGRIVPVPTTEPPTVVRSDLDSSGRNWSRIISANTVEEEIKSIKSAVDKAVTTPGKYKSGGFQDGRYHFSMLAFLFTIVAEHDQEIRWKRHAIAAQERFARAGFNSTAGSVQAFNEAKERKIELQELVGGGSIPGPAGDGETNWEQICKRPPLMRRLNEAYEDRIAKWIADPGQFKKRSALLIHEAEIIAAIAAAIGQEGFEYWDDEDYLDYCERLKRYALDVVRAAELNDARAARTAAGEIRKTCSACHEGYRD